MTKQDVPTEILNMDEQLRQARRDYPQPTDLDSRFLAPREVIELRKLVEQLAPETVLDEFIRGEPNLLSALLHFASTGHHGGMVYPQQVIRPTVAGGKQKGLIPDYLISGKSSGVTTWWVLELKGPAEKIFCNSGSKLRLSNTANNGLLQIHEYVEFCKEHQSSLRETLKLDNFSEPMGILLIGRENELADPRRAKMKESVGGHKSPIRIRTWDSLLRSLEHKLYFHGHVNHNPLRDAQLEDW